MKPNNSPQVSGQLHLRTPGDASLGILLSIFTLTLSQGQPPKLLTGTYREHRLTVAFQEALCPAKERRLGRQMWGNQSTLHSLLILGPPHQPTQSCWNPAQGRQRSVQTTELQGFLHLWSAGPQGRVALHFITLEVVTLGMLPNYPLPSLFPFFLSPLPLLPSLPLF